MWKRGTSARRPADASRSRACGGAGPNAQAGDGTFQLNTSGSAYDIPTKVGSQSADWPIEVLIVDFDRDGFGDLVTSNHLTGNISVMINEMVATNP